MKGLLDPLHHIWQEMQTWPKALLMGAFIVIGFLVLMPTMQKQEHEIAKESKVIEKKGFDLFDEVSWIKGEKELHVLEMRALKGELEKEIALFDNIECAHVILDLALPSSYGMPQEKAKASLLLALKPNAHLTISQLRAISSHVAGAIHGLEPSHIAISDTTGKLYQTFEGTTFFNSPKVVLEEDLKPKIEKIIAKLWSENSFHLTLNASVEEKILGVSVLLDGEIEASMEETLKAQVSNLIQGMEVKCAIHKIPSSQKLPEVKKESSFFSFSILLLFCVLVLSLLALILFSARYFHKKPSLKNEEINLDDFEKLDFPEDLSEMMKKVNLTTLSSLIQEQPPSTIALMLSYLEKDRQDALLAKLPSSIQEEVLIFLAQRGDV